MSSKPESLNDDGTDYRLENPSAELIRNFKHYKNDKNFPRHDKALTIERSHPEFVLSLLKLKDEGDKLGVLKKITSGIDPPKKDLARHDELIRQRLELVRQFAIDIYGSVENFLEWWKS
jgi:hypothetical protein